MYYLSIIIAVLCSVVVPIGLSVYVIKKDQIYLKTVLVGALTFFISQVVIRIPLLGAIQTQSVWAISLSITSPLVFGLFLSLSAGVFEEVARYIAMTYILKNRRGTKQAIAFGIGHGGIEAILLVGINAIVMLFMYIPSVAPQMIIASGVERLSAIAIHITLSVIVMKGVVNRRKVFLISAILLHTLFNFVAIYLSTIGSSVAIIELVLICLGMIGLVFVKKQYSNEKETV
ncbi:YhfC family glutamic-type intramembrane protease [Mollicutes bacterium LVI A0039]|nr:YhfC family glutamic-type intramembrane protease [Mollicutes bacterium LVI A0039]